MHLSSIRYVVRVAETGNFTRAAQQLYVSQPALSQAIQRLEQEIGMPVFVRRKGSLVLTAAGEAILREGRAMLACEARLEGELARLRENARDAVRIGAASSYQRLFLGAILGELHRLHPTIRLDVSDGFSQQLLPAVRSGELDFALAFLPVPGELRQEPIVREEVFLAVPPQAEILKRLPETPDAGSPFPVADLSLCRDEPFITFPRERRIQRLLLEMAGRAGFTPKAAVTSYSTESAVTMAYQGVGLAFVPAAARLLTPEEIRPRYFRLRPGGLYRMLSLISRPDGAPEGVRQTLLRLLRGRARQLEETAPGQLIVA